MSKKIIRDKLHTSIKKSGKGHLLSQITDPLDILIYLKEKIVEEAIEVHDSHDIEDLKEELADIYEVMECICELTGLTIDDIIEKKIKKFLEKGSFKEGHLLEVK